jgi:hypothetical protein
MLRIEVHRMFCYGGHFEYKMASKIQKSSDLDEMWFPSRLSCCELISIVGLLWWPFWIQNGRQNKKNPPIWKKFDFHVDYDVANWYESLVCYGSHFVNGLRFQWKLISRSSLKWGIGWCSKFWYGCRLGTSVFASKHKQTYPANT